MKRFLFTLTLALVALAGCKKDPAPGTEPEQGLTPDTPTTIVFKTSKAVGETITLGFRRSEMENISMDGAKAESALPAGDWGIYTCKLSSQTVTIKGDITLFDCKNSGITEIALTKDLKLFDFNCSENELTSLDVSGLTELESFACSSNKLTSLNIEGCENLYYLECYSNSIKDEAMSDVVNDLPTLGAPGAGRLVVTAEGCGNVITAADVAAAKGKNWDVVDDKFHEFEGHIAVSGVSLNKEGVEIHTEATMTVKALIKPADATNKNVTWTIGNPEIATVNDGVVTGVAEGETTLTVTTVDGGFTASIPVKVVHSPVGSLLGKWAGKVYGMVTIVQGGDANSIEIGGFPSSAAIGLRGYVMPDNTIRIPDQQYEMPWYPTGSDEPDYYFDGFRPLNGDELVISYDSDHIYISDAFEIRELDLITGKYGTYKGKADILIRKQ
jgi:hypothetical protein